MRCWMGWDMASRVCEVCCLPRSNNSPAPLAYCPAPENYMTPDRCFTCTADTVSALWKSAVSCSRHPQQSQARVVITAIIPHPRMVCWQTQLQYSSFIPPCLRKDWSHVLRECAPWLWLLKTTPSKLAESVPGNIIDPEDADDNFHPDWHHL